MKCAMYDDISHHSSSNGASLDQFSTQQAPTWLEAYWFEIGGAYGVFLGAVADTGHSRRLM